MAGGVQAEKLLAKLAPDGLEQLVQRYSDAHGPESPFKDLFPDVDLSPARCLAEDIDGDVLCTDDQLEERWFGVLVEQIGVLYRVLESYRTAKGEPGRPRASVLS